MLLRSKVCFNTAIQGLTVYESIGPKWAEGSTRAIEDSAMS
jgi:hypothetical protein